MKKEYETFITIKNNSGFGWDSEKGVPTAPESVWDAYIKPHLEAERFRQAKALLLEPHSGKAERELENGKGRGSEA